VGISDLLREKTEGGKLSLGRIAFLVLFAAALYLWLVEKRDLYPHMWGMMQVLLAYNFGKKIIPAAKEIFGK